MKDENPIPAQTQRLASLGFMLASVCHEVSNPLAAVSSMLQILQSKRGVTPETLEKGLASIAANIARVTAITKKLGDYSRVGGEAPAPLAVDEAVEAAATLLRHSPPAGTWSSTTAAPRRHGARAPRRARAGAVQHLPQRGAGDAGRGRIEVRAKPKGREVAVDPRHRAGHRGEHCPGCSIRSSPPSRRRGHGLGLAISNELVQEMAQHPRFERPSRRGAFRDSFADMSEPSCSSTTTLACPRYSAPCSSARRWSAQALPRRP